MGIKRLTRLLLLVLIIAGCGKSNNAPSSANLRFTVLDDFGSPAPGATVYLYNSEHDYLNNVNVVTSQATDNSGTVLFTNLKPIVYYYYIGRSTDCSSNYFTTNHLSNSLTGGTTSDVSALINQTGNVNFNNFSADPYYVYFNGTLWGTVNGKSYTSVVVKPGNYAIHVKQASGFATTPLEEDFTATIATCGAGNVNFP
jgi:hypothetical protein